MCSQSSSLFRGQFTRGRSSAQLQKFLMRMH
jgi:hypothetical protein